MSTGVVNRLVAEFPSVDEDVVRDVVAHMNGDMVQVRAALHSMGARSANVRDAGRFVVLEGVAIQEQGEKPDSGNYDSSGRKGKEMQEVLGRLMASTTLETELVAQIFAHCGQDEALTRQKLEEMARGKDEDHDDDGGGGGDGDGALQALLRAFEGRVDASTVRELWDAGIRSEEMRALLDDIVAKIPAADSITMAESEQSEPEAETITFLCHLLPEIDVAFIAGLLRDSNGDASAVLDVLLPLLEDSDSTAERARRDAVDDALPSLAELIVEFPYESEAMLQSVRELLAYVSAENVSTKDVLRALKATNGKAQVALQVLLDKSIAVAVGTAAGDGDEAALRRLRVLLPHHVDEAYLADVWHASRHSIARTLHELARAGVDTQRALLSGAEQQAQKLQHAMHKTSSWSNAGAVEPLRLSSRVSAVDDTLRAELHGKSRADLRRIAQDAMAQRRECIERAHQAFLAHDDDAEQQWRTRLREVDSRVRAAQTLMAVASMPAPSRDSSSNSADVREEEANSMPSIDLHGYYLREALQVLDETLHRLSQSARDASSAVSVLYVITGRGLHSGERGPVIKIAVKEYLRKRGLHFSEVPGNPGALIVQLPRGWYRF